MVKKRLVLIDAAAFCYRAFYAISGLTTSFGQPTNAIYGFVNILNKILKENSPDYLAACFDVSRDTFRAKKFREYKIQRPPMPDELSSQFPFIKEIISAYGISILEKEGYEADDIIATIAEKAKEKDFNVVIVTSDKDMLQLVDDNVEVFSPYKDSGVIYDTKKVYERFGVPPERIPDIIALMGDNADNIPGVKGVGEKTAIGLIKSYGNIEKIFEDIRKIKQEKLRQNLSVSIEMIKLNKELALLDRKADIVFGLEELKPKQPDLKKLFQLFKHLEFKKFLKELPLECAPDENPQLLNIADSELQGLKFPDEEFYLYGGEEDLICSTGGKEFSLRDLGKNIKVVLSDAGIRKIGHNLKELKISLHKKGILLEGLYFDTMIAAYLINPSQAEFGLADLALVYSDNNTALEPQDNKAAMGLILELRPKLEKLLKERQLLKLFHDMEMPLVEVLAEMELSGIKVDLDVLKALGKDLDKRLEKLIDEIYSISGEQFNINSPKQLSRILFEKLKLPVGRRAKTGPSTDEEVLNKLAKSYELPKALLEYRQLMKLKTTYVDALPKLVDPKTGRIHACFNQTGTETGRLSSSNPNLQNLPIKTDIGSRIRKAVVAKGDGHCLLACDYSQIELRILAHISQDKNLIHAFENGKDIHRATAALIFAVEEKDVTDQMREVAKRVNFGIVYGLSYFGLSKDLSISFDEAQAFIDAYFARYAQVKEYIDQQIKKAQENGFVTTILGRRRYIPEINSKNQAVRGFAQRQAVNTPIQGSASDLIKLAMIAIHRDIKEKQLKSRMIIQVHDELVFEVPQEELKEFCPVIINRMENILPLKVPVKVSIKKGKNWLEMEEFRGAL